MPGHKAKLGALFALIDEMFPRNEISEQIKQATPARLRNQKARHQQYNYSN